MTHIYKAEALIDSGSMNKSFISKKLTELLKIRVIPLQCSIGMESASFSAKSYGYCYVSLTLGDRLYRKFIQLMRRNVGTKGHSI